MFEYFSPYYDGGPFRLFGASHVAAIAVIVTAATALVGSARAGSARRRRRLRFALALVLLLNEVGWHLWNLSSGSWALERMLPLHMCAAMVWITVAALLLEKRALYPMLYFFGIAGAAQALITPDLGAFGFPHYRFFQTMLSHGLLVTGGLWVVTVERWRPTARSLAAVLLGLNAYALVILWVNMRIGSNYLFLARKPGGASLMDFFPEWPWYLLILEGLTIVILTLMYLSVRSRPEPQAQHLVWP
ncbi:MAG: TIGR02206 family membrane protein [Gemmatimonadota bacterium]|nr:TIGR02206 family membrane protein [Gemmatimonadota bacterium]